MIARHHGCALARLLRRGLNLVFGVLWGLAVLLIFRLYDGARALALGVVNLSVEIGGTTLQLRSGLTALLLIGGAWLLIRAVRLVLDEELFPRWSLAAGVSFAVSALVRYAIALTAFVLATLALGIDLSRLGLLAGALGLGIGFGLKNIFDNFVSGLILLLERPIHVGDVIAVGSLDGVVKRIGIRSSTLRTSQGAEVIVPNADLIARDVINWTLSDRRRRLEIEVRVDPGADLREVTNLLEDLARETPTLLKDPAPLVLLTAFGDSGLDFRLYAWIEHYEDHQQIASGLRRALVERLRAAHIRLPAPLTP